MSDELEGAEFGDERLSKRLVAIVEQLAPAPAQSFPKAAGDDADLEGTYRFLNHEAVTPQEILAPHVARTAQRVAAYEAVVVAHDTTELRFSTEREGLGRLSDTGHGFLAHFALALAMPTRRPLGVLGLRTIFRRGEPRRKRPDDPENESRRWWESVAAAEQALDGKRAIHVMDCEADSYALFSKLVEAKHRFVIRLRSNHRIEVSQPGAFRLEKKLALAETLCEREVALSARSAKRPEKARRAHPPRAARRAKLGMSGVAVTMRRPETAAPSAETLRLHVVHVREVDAPAETDPVDWQLVTTEPIETTTELEAVVDSYRARWVIEEYFKALKTGCAVEKRQLESSRALLNALAVFVPIAWQLLLLRSLGRDATTEPASNVLSPLRIRLLQSHPKIRLRERPTIRDAMLAIAKLGGHIKNNGDPGWLVLGRGYDDLLLLEVGALLALGKM
jgi:Transposase DNA-binding/Transposase DDE domain